MTALTRRAALVSGIAAIAVVAVPITAQAEDAELITLGRQWIVAYGEWIGTEDKDGTLLKRAHAIEDRMAEIPARSPNGALVKLRVVAENLRIMGDIDEDLNSRLTYQAWQGLETDPVDFERLMKGLRS